MGKKKKIIEEKNGIKVRKGGKYERETKGR